MSNIQGNVNSILGSVEGALVKTRVAGAAKNVNEETKDRKEELRDTYASQRANYLKTADLVGRANIRRALGDQFEEWTKGGYIKPSKLSPLGQLQYKNMKAAMIANKPYNSADFNVDVVPKFEAAVPIRSKLDENSIKAFDSMLEKRVGINNREQFFEHRKEQIMNAPKREIPGLSEEDLRNLDNLGI